MSNSRLDMIGRLVETPIEVIAQRATMRVMAHRAPRVICVDPHGVVTVDNRESAVPNEILLTIGPAGGEAEVASRIAEELAAERELRSRKKR